VELPITVEEAARYEPWELLEALAAKIPQPKPEPLRRVSYLTLLSDHPRRLGLKQGTKDVLPLASRGIGGSEKPPLQKIGVDRKKTYWLYEVFKETGLRARTRVCLLCPNFHKCLAPFAFAAETCARAAAGVARAAGVRYAAYLARASTGKLRESEIPVVTEDGLDYRSKPIALWWKELRLLAKGRKEEAKKVSRLVASQSDLTGDEVYGDAPEWIEFKERALAELTELFKTGIVWRLDLKPVFFSALRGEQEDYREVFAVVEVVDWDAFLKKAAQKARYRVRWVIKTRCVLPYYKLAYVLPS